MAQAGRGRESSGNAAYHVALAGALKRAGRPLDALKEFGTLNQVLMRPAAQ